MELEGVAGQFRIGKNTTTVEQKKKKYLLKRLSAYFIHWR